MPDLKQVGVSTDGRSTLWERNSIPMKPIGEVSTMVRELTLPTEPDREKGRPPGDALGGVITVAGPETLPAPIKSLGAVDWPGPPSRDASKPLRVMVAAAAREEGIEEWCWDLAARCDAEWSFAIWQEDGDKLAGLLEEYGSVMLLPEGDEDAWRLFRQEVVNFRPHLVHAHYHLGARWAQLCGLPAVATVHSGGVGDAFFYRAQHADVSARTTAACDTADYTINDSQKEEYLRLYRNALYPEVDVVMLCNGPANATDIACQRLFQARNLPCRVTLVDGTDGDLADGLSPWLAQDNVQVGVMSGNSMTEAWAGIIAQRPLVFLLDDSTWVGDRGLLPLVREQRRRGQEIAILPQWGEATPDWPEPGLYTRETLVHMRSQAALHQSSFFETYRCQGIDWTHV